MTYNGWSNYQTWATALWIDNEEGTYYAAREMATDAVRYASDGRSARGTLADNLKEWHEEAMPELPASVWSDLLSSALGAVDWYEVADHYLEDVEDEDEDEDEDAGDVVGSAPGSGVWRGFTPEDGP